jgi:transposase
MCSLQTYHLRHTFTKKEQSTVSTPTERDYQIAVLTAQGTTHTEIAKRVGVHYNTVARVLKKPEIQALIVKLRQQTQAQVVESVANTLAERMDEAAEDAFEHLTELVRGAKSETVQFKAAESILDRSTTAPKREIHSSHSVDVEKREIHIHIDAALMAQLRQGYIEEEPEDMIDITPQPMRPTGHVLAELEAANRAEHG